MEQSSKVLNCRFTDSAKCNEKAGDFDEMWLNVAAINGNRWFTSLGKQNPSLPKEI
jgi:hypothetical protein